MLEDLFDSAITHVHDYVAQRRRFAAVRRHQDRGVLLGGNSPQQCQDQIAGDGVQISGWFIGEQQFGFMHQRASDCDTLHLAAGELVGKAGGVGFEFDPIEPEFGSLARAGCAGEQQREFDVFDHV